SAGMIGSQGIAALIPGLAGGIVRTLNDCAHHRPTFARLPDRHRTGPPHGGAVRLPAVLLDECDPRGTRPRHASRWTDDDVSGPFGVGPLCEHRAALSVPGP